MGNFNAGAIEASMTLKRSDWTRDLKKTQAEIRKLEETSVTIGVDLDTDNAQVQMDNLELMLEDLGQQEYSPTVDVLIVEANEALDRLEERLDALDRRTVVVGADLDADNAYVALDNLEIQLDGLDSESINIPVDLDSADAEARLVEIGGFVQALSMSEPTIDIDVDGYATATAQLATLEGQIAVLNGQDIDIDVDVDRAALAGLVGAPGSSGGGGYLGLLRILIYTILALLPVLSVATGAAAAAIVGFSAALAGAIGPLAVVAAGLAGLVMWYKEVADKGKGLPPFMQDFADALDLVKDAWHEVRQEIAPEGFELMADALELVAGILPDLVPLFEATADMLGEVLDSISDFVKSPDYKEMLDFFGGFGVDMLKSFIDIGGNLLVFFGRLFDAIAPFARQMMQGLEDITAGWAEWADDLENNKAFQHFVDNALEYGPRVLDLLGSILDAFMNIGHALEPFAGPMLTGLIGFFDFIAGMDPNLLAGIIAGLAGLWLGFHVLAPVISAVVGGLGALAGALGIGMAPLLLIIGAVAGLAALFVHLWRTNETFRQSIIDAWNAIKGAVLPIVEDVVAAIRENWGPIKTWAISIWNSIKSIVVDAMRTISRIVRWLMKDLKQEWKEHGDTIIRIAKFAFGLIGSIIKGTFQFIQGLFRFLRGVVTGDWGAMLNGLKTMARGLLAPLRYVWNAVKDDLFRALNWIKDKVGGLIGFFRNMPSQIRSAASGMWDGISDAFRSMINTVIGWWNNLSFSINIPDKIPGMPDSFTISTPNLGYLAKGAFVTEPMLAVVGEGDEPEIVSPESKMREIVRENSTGNIDYGRLAAMISAALMQALERTGVRIAPEDLNAILERAGASVQIDAGSDPDKIVRRMVNGLSFELRRLGFGGVANV